MKFSPDGKGKRFIGDTGASAIALDSQGNIHLLIAKDTDNWLVRIYQPNGVGVAWPATIKLNNVSGIALNKSGRLFAVSQGNAVVRMWEPDGRMLVQAIKTGAGRQDILRQLHERHQPVAGWQDTLVARIKARQSASGRH
jgi:hypothetical protein